MAYGINYFTDTAGARRPLKSVDGNPAVVNSTIYQEIGLGNVSGTRQSQISGLSEYIDNTAYKPIWPLDAQISWPTVETQMSIVSTSTNDAAGGTGVRTVYIIYVDEDYVQHSTTVTMDGTTPVQLPVSDTYRINFMFMDEHGSLGYADGDISIQDTATGALKYEAIGAGLTINTSIKYSVPVGYIVAVDQLYASSGHATVGKNIRWRLQTTYDFRLGAIQDHWVLRSAFQTQDSSIERVLNIPDVYTAGIDIYLEARSDNATDSWVTADVRGWIKTLA